MTLFAIRMELMNTKKEVIMKILVIYDNPDFCDRYSVYLNFIEKKENGNTFYAVFGMSENPCSPLGFAQHSSGILGPHNGKEISKKELPQNCQKLLSNMGYK